MPSFILCRACCSQSAPDSVSSSLTHGLPVALSLALFAEALALYSRDWSSVWFMDAERWRKNHHSHANHQSQTAHAYTKGGIPSLYQLGAIGACHPSVASTSDAHALYYASYDVNFLNHILLEAALSFSASSSPEAEGEVIEVCCALPPLSTSFAPLPHTMLSHLLSLSHSLTSSTSSLQSLFLHSILLLVLSHRFYFLLVIAFSGAAQWAPGHMENANKQKEAAMKLKAELKNAFNALLSTEIQNEHDALLCEIEKIYLYADNLLLWVTNLSLGTFKTPEVLLQNLYLFPQDILSHKLLQLNFFVKGDSNLMIAALSDINLINSHLPSTQHAKCSPWPTDPIDSLKLMPMLRNQPYFHGLLSFALEERGLINQAGEQAWLALTIVPFDFWAMHSLAHVVYYGHFQESSTPNHPVLSGPDKFSKSQAIGIDLIRNRFLPSVRSSCMTFLGSHLTFHLGLLYLDRGLFGLDSAPSSEDASASTLLHELWPSVANPSTARPSMHRLDLDSIECGGDPYNPEAHMDILNFIGRFEIRYLLSKSNLNSIRSALSDSEITFHSPSLNNILFSGESRLVSAFRSVEQYLPSSPTFYLDPASQKSLAALLVMYGSSRTLIGSSADKLAFFDSKWDEYSSDPKLELSADNAGHILGHSIFLSLCLNRNQFSLIDCQTSLKQAITQLAPIFAPAPASGIVDLSINPYLRSLFGSVEQLEVLSEIFLLLLIRLIILNRIAKSSNLECSQTFNRWLLNQPADRVASVGMYRDLEVFVNEMVN